MPIREIAIGTVGVATFLTITSVGLGISYSLGLFSHPSLPSSLSSSASQQTTYSLPPSPLPTDELSESIQIDHHIKCEVGDVSVSCHLYRVHERDNPEDGLRQQSQMLLGVSTEDMEKVSHERDKFVVTFQDLLNLPAAVIVNSVGGACELPSGGIIDHLIFQAVPGFGQLVADQIPIPPSSPSNPRSFRCPYGSVHRIKLPIRPSPTTDEVEDEGNAQQLAQRGNNNNANAPILNPTVQYILEASCPPLCFSNLEDTVKGIYKQCLTLTEEVALSTNDSDGSGENEVRSIALPCLGTNILKLDFNETMRWELEAMKQWLMDHPNTLIETIYIVLYERSENKDIELTSVKNLINELFPLGS